MKRLLFLALAAWFATWAMGCTTPPPPVNPPVTDCAKNSWCWSNLVESKITPAMLAANLGSFCPNQKSVDRKKLWISIIKAVSKAESAWNPKAVYVEKSMGIDPITGRTVESVGMMSLSCQDVINYASLPTAKLVDCRAHPGAILDPILNLQFAMEIIDKLVSRNPSLDISDRKSVGAYFSTVWMGHDAARAQVKKEIPGCS